MNEYRMTMVLVDHTRDVYGTIVKDAPEIEFTGAFAPVQNAFKRVGALFNHGKTDYTFGIHAIPE